MIYKRRFDGDWHLINIFAIVKHIISNKYYE